MKGEIIMPEIEELLKISSQILKLEQINAVQNASVYEELILDLASKEEQILEKIEKDNHLMWQAFSYMNAKYGYDFNQCYLVNMVILKLSPQILHVCALLQSIWEFYMYQDFSGLTRKEAKSLKTNPYFQTYEQAFYNYDDFKWMVSIEFLEKINQNTPETRHVFNFLNNYNNREMMPAIKDTAAYKKSEEFILYSIQETVKELICTSEKNENYQKKQALIQFLLSKIIIIFPTFHDKLQEFINNLEEEIDETHWQEFNSLMAQGGLKIFHFPQIEATSESFSEEKFYGFDFDIICEYDELYQKLQALGKEIYWIYEKLWSFENPMEDRRDLFMLKELLRQEKELIKPVLLEDFQTYLEQIYGVHHITYPLEILDNIPKNSWDKEGIRRLIHERIINYKEVEPGKNQNAFSSKPTTFLTDANPKENGLTNSFLESLYRSSSMAKYYDILDREENIPTTIKKVQEGIEDCFLTSLSEIEAYLEFYNLLFIRNDRMERLLQNNFTYPMRQLTDLYPYYPRVKDHIFNEIKNEESKLLTRNDEKSLLFFKLYIKSCLPALKAKDCRTLVEYLEECEERVKLERKKPE